ncbi:type II methionyl aminopeptidase [Candidatus Micrarchaeota archaeon]|nr:type II methionyl aminopeptidase [Candidatus Micrarchaeota archaeon]
MTPDHAHGSDTDAQKEDQIHDGKKEGIHDHDTEHDDKGHDEEGHNQDEDEHDHDAHTGHGHAHPSHHGDNHKHYLEAARVAVSVRSFAEDFVKPGMKLLDIAERIEKEIVDQGAGMAFQATLSLNEAAAHDTPKMADERIFTEADVLKVDFGVHAEGCIVDQAFTLNPNNEHIKLIEAAESALADALSVVRVGANVRDVGQVIQDAIVKRGFKPVENLCGHSMSPYIVHAGVSVPNVPRGDYVFQEGDVFAIEPFATNGGGKVTDGNLDEIFSMVQPRPVRLPQSRKAAEWIMDNRQTLPFAKRHLLPVLGSAASVELAIRDLTRQGILHDYPVLVEINKGLVAQAETTVIVEKDSAKILV